MFRSLAFVALVSSWTAVGSAIVRRADRADAEYLRLGARVPAVVAIGRLGDATLVRSNWLLTAAHVARAVASGRGGDSVRIGDRNYAVDRIAVHPLWTEMGSHDIALLHLSQSVRDVAPLRLSRRSDERGKIVTLVGHGGSGIGSDRVRVEDGQRRGATTSVDSTDAKWIYVSFDAPPRGTALEGAPGAGDSGGPALIDVKGHREIAGVSSAGYDGMAGPGTYGAVDVFTRVSTHVAWLERAIASPELATPRTHAAIVPAYSTPAFPDTPVGKRYTAFLRAMHANTDSAIVAFLEANFDDGQLTARPARERLPNFRRLAQRLHDARVVSIERSEPLVLTVKLHGSAGDTVIELECAPTAPNKLLDWRRLD